MTVFCVIIAWIVLVVLLCHQITRLVAESTSGFAFRCMIFPGVLVHELSHWLMCKLTGAPVRKMQLFGRLDPQQFTTGEQQSSRKVPAQWGGYVLHGPSRLPVVGDSLIAFAPLFGGVCVLALLTWLMGDPLGLLQHPGGDTTLTGGLFNDIRQLTWSILCVIGRFPTRIASQATSPLFWLYLYVIVSVSVSLAPSRQDFVNSWKSLWQNALGVLLVFTVAAAVIWLLGKALAHLTAHVRVWLTGVVAFTLSILLLTLILVWLLTRVTRWLRARRFRRQTSAAR